MDDLPSKTNLTNFFMNKSNRMRLQELLKIEFRQQVKSFPEKTYIYSVQRIVKTYKRDRKLLILHVIMKKLIQLYSLSHIFCVRMASSIR